LANTLRDGDFGLLNYVALGPGNRLPVQCSGGEFVHDSEKVGLHKRTMLHREAIGKITYYTQREALHVKET
jgi:hypothetical protein